MKLNVAWIKFRWTRRHCDHDWSAGDGAGHQACQRPDCGVWRWWPVMK